MNFDIRRSELYREVLNVPEGLPYSQKLRRELLSLMEECTLELMTREDSFFGFFLMQMKREVSNRCRAPLAVMPKSHGYILYINPRSLLICSSDEIKALLKHEIYHIIFGHHRRIRDLRSKYSLKAINLAMDVAVNQHIKNLPGFCRKLHEIKLEYNVPIEENMPLELYAELIQKAIDKLSLEEDSEDKSFEDTEDYLEDAHELWLVSQDISKEELEAMEKRAIKESFKGSIPIGMEEYLGSGNKKGELSWQELLKNSLATMKSGYSKTITRKDRRQPNRLDIRGVLPKRIPKIIAAIDISGSMTGKELQDILIELSSIVNNYQGELRVIECDSEIRRTYNVKSSKDIRKPLEHNGATAFSPVFKYIKENNLRDYYLLYFTDGKGERELLERPVNRSTIWIITGNEELSVENAPGSVVSLRLKDAQKEEASYGIKVVKEMQREWGIDTEGNSIQSLRVDI
ncbi:VWA-like domain-containing protein [Alloiococcus sp. CFN-8]|uniref:vWA domain-containing protein n=1 Tax=Alloiococcus sp. CFN-8 TaxID=3416081 RepID=UPI003CF7C55F